jgi:dienelactone hydrolase
MKPCFPALLLLLATSARGQDPVLLKWMDTIAQQQLQQRAAQIASIKTTAQAEARKEVVRAKVLELIGGLPDYNGPLKAKVARTIKRDSYVIEDVIYQSLPGLYVTANLYRPQAAGTFPGILLPLGHWDYGKSAVQQIAANLALKGFVVLTYDPIGQGERLQAFDVRFGKSIAGGSTEQHFMAGTQSILVGQSFARYRIWDAKRSLDYLLSRPEVDREKIGVTGCSGGGTVTTYISALDPRVKVAAPACYMNSFQTIFSNGALGDSEQSLPGFLAAGLDLTDYPELFAPNPWLMMSTEKDFFTPASAKLVYDEASRWYDLYDAKDKIKWVVGPGGHGTPLVLREAIYEWFIRWLKDGKGDWHEQPVHFVPARMLTASRTGQVAFEPGSRDIYQIIAETPKTVLGQAEMLEQIMSWVKYEKRPPIVKSMVADSANVEKVTLESEPGLDISLTLYKPQTGSGRRRALLILESYPHAPEIAEQLAEKGSVVAILNVRGRPIAPIAAWSGDWMPNTQAWLIGRNLPGMRGLDILRAVDYLEARPDVDSKQIGAVASDVPGIWVLLAAAIDTRISSVYLDRTPHSIQLALNGPLHRDLHDATMPGFALHWDVVNLVTAMKGRKLVWTDPTDWMRNLVYAGDQFQYRTGNAPVEAWEMPEYLK